MAAEVLAVVGAAKAVSAQRDQARAEPGGQSVGQNFHVVAGGDDGAFAAGERGVQVGWALGFRGMEAVPALGFEGVAAEFDVAGDRPDVGLNVVLFAKDLLGFQDFVEDRSGAEELGGGIALRSGFELVQAAHNALANVASAGEMGGHFGLRVILVVHRDVVEDLLVFCVHAAQAVLHDDRKFVGEGGVVAETGGHGAGEDVGVAVLVLQALAEHGGAAGGAAHQEALAARVGEGPDHVADALEAEHGVVHVKGHGGHAVVGVGGAGGGEAGHGAGFGDALFQDLAVFFFAIAEQHVAVVGRVFLAFRGVDTDLLDDGFQAEGAALIGHDGNEELADGWIFEKRPQNGDEDHGGGNGAAFRPAEPFLEEIDGRRGEGEGLGFAPGQVAAEFGAAGLHVLQFGSLRGGLPGLAVFRFFLGHRNVEALHELGHAFVGQLFLVVRGVAAFR